MQIKQSRYPGAQSFNSSQRNIFFGRSIDIEKLTQMIELEQMVLVYSKSGIGKTSLIDAGVLPDLEEKNNYTLQKIRYGSWTNKSESIKTISTNILSRFYESQTYLDKIILNDQSLWHYAKMWQLKQVRLKKTTNQTLLLIFDQFEELFTYPEEQVIKFNQELAELLFTNVPQRFINQKELLQDIKPDFLTSEEEALLFTKLNIKILFAIRSDRMSQLNRMSDYIPRILLKHYELAPLNEQQAINAIQKPAQLNGDFSSSKFTYHEDALKEIMYFLTKDNTQTNNIESFQLQILCQVVERKVKAFKLAEIKAHHIKPVKDIYQNYYDNLIKDLQLSLGNKRRARIMIEDGLIEEATKRRLQLSGEQIELKFSINKQTLSQLVNERLLRTEELDKFHVYELSHDTLVDPILESRKIRKEKEEKEIKIKVEREKALKEKIERRKEQKRQRQIIFVIGIAAIISIAFGIFGLVNMQKAKSLLRQNNLRDAQHYFDSEKFTIALNKYYYLRDSLEFDISGIDDRIDSCIVLDSISKQFYLYMKSADSLILKRDFEDNLRAYEYYKKAKELNYPFADKEFSSFNIKLKQSNENLKMQAISSIDAGGVGYYYAHKILSALIQRDPENNEVKKLYEQVKSY